MSKIIINEYDKTKAGSSTYENFSVVVPGYCGTPTSTEVVFDDNGIYECSNQEDFIKYIGKKKAEEKAAVACVIIGGSGGTKTEAEWTAAHNATDRDIYTRTENETHTVGYLKDADWIYTKSTTYSDSAIYTIIKNDSVGSDAQSGSQLGNQIAYELVGMGYTVLFKKITGAISDLEDDDFWACLKDKATYDFRYITTGGYCSNTAYEKIYAVANHVNATLDTETASSGRGDCIALVDVDETGFTQKTVVTDIKNKISSLSLGKYASINCPKVIYAGKVADEAVYENLTFPASFHYLACAAYARNELSFNEWYAPAGYTRGVCSKTVAGTTFKLGDIAINALQPRKAGTDITKAVNVIANIRGKYYFWGNRTAHTLDDNGLVASHFLNIRQLCCTIKKQIYNTCRKLTFNPNSDVLWGDFCNAIKPTLEAMKADQGISDYKIIKVKDPTKALLTAKLRIVPIEAVEDFVINMYLEDSVAGVTVGIDE